jgi:serine/threonine protein kinase
MWSIGVIAFMMLGGDAPFSGKDDKETMRKIQSCNY